MSDADMPKKKPTAIVLGGTVPHIALIQRLKNRGYHTLLVDYLDNPPAQAHADEHIQESTLDKEKVLSIARETNADLVISAAIDQSNATACYVGEQLSLPIPYTYATALVVTNKGLMKERFLAAGIPTARYVFVKDFEGYEASGLALPAVVKPADSTGSAGVRKVKNTAELVRALAQALAMSRTGMAIVEEFKQGTEVSADFYVQKGVAHLLTVRRKYVMDAGEGTVLQSPGSVTPVELSAFARQSLDTIAQKIVHAFSLHNTPLLVQALVDSDEINVIEFAPRIGGGLAFRTIQLMTGFDITDAAIDSFLGVEPIITIKPSTSYFSTNIIYGRPGVLGGIRGVEQLQKEGVIKEYYEYKSAGSIIAADMSTRSRVGAFIIEGNNENELVKHLRRALREIEVSSESGSDMMRRDIYDRVFDENGHRS